MTNALVSEDGRLARLIVGACRVDLGAAELEALIWDLAACRVAMTPRRTATLFAGSRIHLGAAVRHTTDTDGQSIVAIMHPALGWIGALKDQSSEAPLDSSLLIQRHRAGRDPASGHAG